MANRRAGTPPNSIAASCSGRVSTPNAEVAAHPTATSGTKAMNPYSSIIGTTATRERMWDAACQNSRVAAQLHSTAATTTSAKTRTLTMDDVLEV